MIKQLVGIILVSISLKSFWQKRNNNFDFAKCQNVDGEVVFLEAHISTNCRLKVLIQWVIYASRRFIIPIRCSASTLKLLIKRLANPLEAASFLSFLLVLAVCLGRYHSLLDFAGHFCIQITSALLVFGLALRCSWHLYLALITTDPFC